MGPRLESHRSHRQARLPLLQRADSHESLVIHPSAIEMESFAKYLFHICEEFGTALSGENLRARCH